MKTLIDFRTTRRDAYAPNPVSAGFCLIWIGLALIAGYLRRLPKRTFYRLQAMLVFQWTGQRNYTHQTARAVWGATAFVMAGCVFIGYFLAWFLL